MAAPNSTPTHYTGRVQTTVLPDTSLNTSGRAALGCYLGGLGLALMYSMLRAWPVPPAEGTTHQDAQYLIMAAVAGALGSYIHLASSFIERAGKGSLSTGWIWWYLLRPWIGSALALVLYFVLRAGLITGAGEEGTRALNPYGVAALAALAGMFSRQATEKLRQVFENVCSTDQSDSESSPED